MYLPFCLICYIWEWEYVSTSSKEQLQPMAN